jgi:hypothetical protein
MGGMIAILVVVGVALVGCRGRGKVAGRGGHVNVLVGTKKGSEWQWGGGEGAVDVLVRLLALSIVWVEDVAEV